MKVLLTGGTGLIGRRFCRQAREKGWDLTLTTRNIPKQAQEGVKYVAWDGQSIDPNAVGPVDAVINLAGCGIADQKWTPEYKKLILSSRLNSTRACVEYIRQHEARFGTKPGVFLSASAVGYYGTHRSEPVTENDGPGNDFLSKVGVEWEAAAQGAGIRTVILRTGVVLAQEGGAFPRLLKPFKFYAGGYVGCGKQGFPWIHIDDVVGMMFWAMENPNVEGPINLTAPDLQTNRSLARVLGALIGKPSGLSVPVFVVRTLMGESAVIIVEGQLVRPQKALDLGYVFKYPDARSALKDLLGLK
jgi:uncharacterized protein (TIGR01777 family)